MEDPVKSGLKTTELWLTAITALVNVILASTAPSAITTVLIICLSVAAAIYLLCRTAFKIARLRYQPDVVTSWKAQGLAQELSDIESSE
jgi:hypothetical protein